MLVPEQQIESLELVPNFLSVVPFTPDEVHTVVGSENEYERELLASNFNWIATYLCGEAGMTEDEIAVWFRRETSDLGFESPLTTWRTKEGFWDVYDYAQFYKDKLDHEVGSELHTQKIATRALGVIRKSFEAAGVDLTSACPADSDLTHSRVIRNPYDSSSPAVRWTGNTSMENFQVISDDGSSKATFFIARYLLEDPTIVETGINRQLKDGAYDSHSASYLQGQPPSPIDIASFMIPLANQAQNRSLQLVEA